MPINKCFRMLQFITVASFLNSFTILLPFIPASASTWISWTIMGVMCICMCKLALANDRYRKAGIYRGAMLVCSLITTFLYASRFLPLAASVFSIIAVYHEFQGHAELAETEDSKLAQNWRSLFMWEILAGFVLSVVSTVVAILLIVLSKDISAITGMIVGRVPQLVVDCFYLYYLQRMIILFRRENEVPPYDE